MRVYELVMVIRAVAVTVMRKNLFHHSTFTSKNAVIYNYAAENIISTTKTKQKTQNNNNDGSASSKQIKYLKNTILINIACKLNTNNS